MAFPDHVIADELIEAAWGNAVVDTLTLLQTASDAGAVRHYANIAAAKADATVPVGGLVFATDTNTLWIKESGGWVILSEPLQVVAGNAWANGVAAWSNAYGVSGAPVTAANAQFQRSMGLCYVYSDGTFNGAGGYVPQLALPFAYLHIEGVLQVAVLQPGQTYFPGWCVTIGPSSMQPWVIAADSRPGGGNCTLRVAINTLTPFNWGIAGGTCSVSGWYQMSTRYS